MKPVEVQAVVCEVLGQIQAASGEAVPKIDGTTVPLKTLPKFDSVKSFLATGAVGIRLNLDIDPKINLFGDRDGQHPINKTVDVVCDLLSQMNEKDAAISQKNSSE